MNFSHLKNKEDSGNTETGDDGKCEDQVAVIDHVPVMTILDFQFHNADLNKC